MIRSISEINLFKCIDDKKGYLRIMKLCKGMFEFESKLTNRGLKLLKISKGLIYKEVRFGDVLYDILRE